MAPATALLLLVGTLAALPAQPAHAAGVPGTSCSVFPSDNVWNTDISNLPVNSKSATWVASTTPSSGKLHPDFGASPYGIPFNLATNATPTATFTFQYASESDPGRYPIPPSAQIEQGSDAHMLTINSDTCKLYETFATDLGTHSAGSGAIFDLGSDQLRPAGWTSADAAGLPIFPGLVRVDEVQAGFIGHAIRFTVHNTNNSYLWPARHAAGISTASLPPMGARFRLKANYDISGYGAAAQVVLTALKHYGLIVADNGSDWYFQGTEDARWNSGPYPQMVADLKNVPAGAFEAVDESSLMADPNSARVVGRLASQSQPAPVGSRGAANQSPPNTSPPGRTPRGIVNSGTKPRVASLSGLKVAANRLTNSAGQPVVLRGFNRSGTEYACIQGWGMFDGPSDAASVTAIASWRANYVRVPLNEDCWLGINGAPAAYGGANYRNAIVNFVNLLNQNGIYVELSLIWGAPGTYQATYQPNAPDQDHGPAFWTSVATTFKSNPNVIFGVWGETTVSWSCFLNGCGNEATYGPQNAFYQTAGTQELVNTIRATGAAQPIAVPGINYANDLSQWLAYAPTDSQHALVAEAHIYGNNACGAQNSGACLTSTIAPVTASVPVVFGETGETYDDSECSSANMQVILPWADAHGVGYAAWTWDTWTTCSGLIAGYEGTPNTTIPVGAEYGKYIHDHLLVLFLTSREASQSPASIAGSRGATNPSTAAPMPPSR